MSKAVDAAILAKRLESGLPFIDAQLLAVRWGVDSKTALRYCRFNHVGEIRFVTGGKIFFRVADIEGLEQKICLPK